MSADADFKSLLRVRDKLSVQVGVFIGLELPRFRGHLNAWGEMIAREVSDAENETALPAGLPR